MFSDDDLLPISALQHLEFCRRRCALVHIDGVWADNAQTAEGTLLHKRVHGTASGMEHGVRVARGLRLASLQLGVFGVADIVEFQPVENGVDAVVLPHVTGLWRPFPVEYKRGRRKSEISYFVQLCAQAICLEEMLKTRILYGALFHGRDRRRQTVPLDDSLRQRTIRRAEELHCLVKERALPPPEPGPKCRFCSLIGRCMPRVSKTRSAREYCGRMIRELLTDAFDEKA